MASYNFRLGFALSNGPHLHSAYLVTVPFDLILAVLHESNESRMINIDGAISETSNEAKDPEPVPEIGGTGGPYLFT